LVFRIDSIFSKALSTLLQKAGYDVLGHQLGESAADGGSGTLGDLNDRFSDAVAAPVAPTVAVGMAYQR
jgi:hypothetical protein